MTVCEKMGYPIIFLTFLLFQWFYAYFIYFYFFETARIESEFFSFCKFQKQSKIKTFKNYKFLCLTLVNHCLTIFCFRRYVSLQRLPLDEMKKSIKPLGKKKWKKCQRLTHFPSKELYMHIYNQFFIQKWVNRLDFFIGEENLKNYGMTEKPISA